MEVKNGVHMAAKKVLEHAAAVTRVVKHIMVG
jgi:hypothetical protein